MTNNEKTHLRRFFGHKINTLRNQNNWFRLDNIKVKEWCFESDDYGIEIAGDKLYLKSEKLYLKSEKLSNSKKKEGNCQSQISIGNNIHRGTIFQGPNMVLKKGRSVFHKIGHSNEYALLFSEDGSFNKVKKNNFLSPKVYYVSFNLDNNKAVNFILQAEFNDISKIQGK